MSQGDGKNTGRGPAVGATVKGPAPDKDWYQKWQEQLRERGKERPR